MGWGELYHIEFHSHNLTSRIQFLLVLKIGLCEHSKNDPQTHQYVVLKNWMEIWGESKKKTRLTSYNTPSIASILKIQLVLFCSLYDNGSPLYL